MLYKKTKENLIIEKSEDFIMQSSDFQEFMLRFVSCINDKRYLDDCLSEFGHWNTDLLLNQERTLILLLERSLIQLYVIHHLKKIRSEYKPTV